MRKRFDNTTLVLLGHGSTKNDDSSKPVRQHAAELRRRGLFADVREAFWKQDPRAADVLASIATSRVAIVPFFVSAGYFSEEAIPEALGFKPAGASTWSRQRTAGEQTLYYTRPVGVHPQMTELLLHRAEEAVTQHPFPRRPKPAETSLFVAGHGTPRNPHSREAIERQAAAIDERRLYAEVRPCFIEEQPLITDVPRLATSRNVVVVPFFISDGLHVGEDIPRLLGEPEAVVKKRVAAGHPTWRNPTERGGKLIWLGHAIGSDPGMADVIVELTAAAVECGERRERGCAS